jgi:hypothetical protein
MVATLNWEHSIAATTASWLDCAHLRFKAANDNTNDNNNPMVIPATGVNYSFEKALTLNITVAPDTNCSNLKVSLSTAPVHTGITMSYGFTTTGLYVTPVGTNSTLAATGTLGTATVAWSNAGTAVATGIWGDILWLQMDLATTATRGAITQFNVIATFDEI